jgi:hypothetical protein
LSPRSEPAESLFPWDSDTSKLNNWGISGGLISCLKKTT